MKTILLVEDDEFIRDGLKSILTLEHYDVIDCAASKEAEELIQEKIPDMAILDIHLPDGNGFDLCRSIRKTMSFPILFLTCRDDEISTVRGFESGGDDYVVKPFRVRELLLRIQSLLRRSTITASLQNQLTFRDIVMDIEKRLVMCGEQIIYLTPNEFKILQLLLKNSGKTITRQMLLENIWDVDGSFIDDNTLSVHISALRRKLGDNGAFIKTVRGTGYTINKEKYLQ